MISFTEFGEVQVTRQPDLQMEVRLSSGSSTGHWSSVGSLEFRAHPHKNLGQKNHAFGVVIRLV